MAHRKLFQYTIVTMSENRYQPYEETDLCCVCHTTIPSYKDIHFIISDDKGGIVCSELCINTWVLQNI
jgi:hypothetical protein